LKSQEQLKNLYNKEYVESYENKSPERLQGLLKYIKLNKTYRTVDFACGNGLLMSLVAPKVQSYTGVDFSELFIKAAKIKQKRLSIENANFACSDIHEFSQNHRNTFDVCFAMDVSEHIYDNEWVSILKSIRKCLKPGGKLYIHTPNAEFFLEIMKDKNIIVKQFVEHIAVRTPESNASLLKDAGFSIENVWLIPHYNILKHIHFISFLPFIGKFFKARILIEATA
jgi:2-polyprenyl-6-hydroxyphenyl methylase/3-demethylubiquinone-9 3-methyltransferase